MSGFVCSGNPTYHSSTQEDARKVLIAPQRAGRWGRPRLPPSSTCEVTRAGCVWSALQAPSFEFFGASAGHTTTLNFSELVIHQLRIEARGGKSSLGNVLDQLDGGSRVFALFPQMQLATGRIKYLFWGCASPADSTPGETHHSQRAALTTHDAASLP